MQTEERLDELLGVRSEMWKACSDCLSEDVCQRQHFCLPGESLQSEVRTESAKQQEQTLLSR